MTNGINITTKEDAKELYEKDPGLAFGLLFENIKDIKEQRKKDRVKNIAVQFAGGIIGGIGAAWLFIRSYIELLIK